MKIQYFFVSALLCCHFQCMAMNELAIKHSTNKNLSDNSSYYWEDNFAQHSLKNWDYQLNPNAVTLIKDPLDNHNTVALFTLSEKETWPNGHTRTELKHNVLNSHEGDKTTFEFTFLAQHLFTQKNSIAYWESNNTYQQAFSFSIQPKNKRNNLTFSTNLPIEIEHFNHPINHNQWNTIKVTTTWSKMEEKGRLTVYFNTKKIVDELHLATKPDKNPMFMQMGLHRNNSSKKIDKIHIKNVNERQL